MKTFHANMLKKYFDREFSDTVSVLSSVITDDSDVDDLEKGRLVETPSIADDSKSQVHISDKLDGSQVSQLNDLLREFKDVLSDLPGNTDFGKHDIKLTTDQPIRSKPYPIPFAMQETIKDEVRKR